MIFFKRKKEAPAPAPKKKEAPSKPKESLAKPKKIEAVKEPVKKEKAVPASAPAPAPKLYTQDETRLLTAEGHFRRLKKMLGEETKKPIKK